MKTISVRVLASTIKELKEPVEVVTLDKKTRQVVALGVFLPKGWNSETVSPAVMERLGDK